MMTDSISAFLTSIRNANMAKHPKVDVEPNKMRISLAEIFKRYGFINGYKLFKFQGKPVLRVYLRYGENGKTFINGLKRMSKPSYRRYVSSQDIPKIRGGVGLNVLSTPKGVIPGHVAKKLNVGGELLCQVW